MTGSDDRPDDVPNDAPGGREHARDEAALWAEIVANYGERVEIDHDDDRAEAADEPSGPDDLEDLADPVEPSPILDAPEERFVPPPPPPLPKVEGRRLWAWIGLFGAPALLLISLVLTISMPPVIAWALVIWFITGFCWLVYLMPPGPRPPGDDGARV